MPIYLLRVAIISIALTAFTTTSVSRAGESSGSWRGKWWNFYERALVRGELGEWEAARSDLAKAIDLREKDQRRARTYGMHFMDYFPHREMGVAYFQLGDYKKALAELEISYKSEESAKAAFYLNKVRSTIIREHGARLQLPGIKVSSPVSGQSFRSAAITVSGHIEAAGFVASVRINGKPYRFDLARNDLDFSMDVPVDEDDSRIIIEASDLMGNSSRTEIPVLIDREGPSISLSTISRMPGERDKIRINAALSDSSGIRELLVNGVSIATASAREMALDTIVTLAPGTSTVRIEASDLLGNQISVEFDPDRVRAALLKKPAPVLLAMNGPGFFTSDKEAPVVSLKDVEDLPAVFIDRYYVEGEAFDNVKVEKITVNGREIQIAKGKKVFFSKMLKLKEGQNKITVEATDSSGNAKTAEFSIRRIVPAARQTAARMSLSVLPFNGKIKNSSVQDMSDDFLVAALVEQKRFQIVEREKLKQVLQEQKLSKEKLTDPEHSLKIGKLISADAMLATTITEGQKSVEIISRLVNTETAEVMGTKDAYIEDKSLAAIKELMEGLASKLTLGFPVVEGIVVKRDNGTVYSDIDQKSGVHSGMGAAIYRRGKEIRHPVTGKSLGWDMTKIGDGIFEEVGEGFSKVRLHDRTKHSAEIQIKDVVITR